MIRERKNSKALLPLIELAWELQPLLYLKDLKRWRLPPPPKLLALVYTEMTGSRIFWIRTIPLADVIVRCCSQYIRLFCLEEL